MRALIAGAGSLGTVYGGYLARAGCDVQLLTRPAHAQAITERGTVQIGGTVGDFAAALRATADPFLVEDVDVVILLCKAPDTAAVLAGLGHIADDVALAVSLQNGMVGGAQLARWCDPSHVVGGVSMVGGTMVRAGVADHTFAGPTFLGALPGTSTAAGQVLAVLGSALQSGGLDVVVTDRIESVEWSKLVHASPSMALTALTRLDFHQVLVLPELASLFLDLLLEGVAIADAAGVQVDDWPHLLAVRTLAALPRDAALSQIQAYGDRLIDQGMTDVRISMLQSVERGRRTEVDAIHGHLVRTARAVGVDAPTTTMVQRLLAGLDRTLV